MTEAEFQKQVIGLAHLFGWRVAHFRAVKTPTGYRTPVAADGAGFPDLVLAKAGLIIFAELKTEKGRVSDAQKAWLKELQGAGERVLVVVWRPSDWDAIEAAIRKGEW
jgi:hypothetical protein